MANGKKGQYSEIPDPKTIAWIVGLVIVAVVVLSVLFGSWYSVPEGHVGVMFDKRSGFDYDEKPQGWNFKIPFVQSVTDMPFRTQEIGFYGSATQGGRGQYGAINPKDKNGITFAIDVTVRYSLDPTQAAEFVEQKGRGTAAMESVLVTATRSEAVRGILGKENQEDIPGKLEDLAVTVREQLQARVDREATGKLEEGYIRIESVDLRGIDYNDQIEQKISEKQQAKQEAEKQEYVLQEAKYQKEIELTNAERDKQAAILRAEGESEAVILVAEAKAKGITAVNRAYQDMPASYVAVQAYEAIKPTDKIILGLDSLGSSSLPVWNMNELVGANQVTPIISNP